MSKQVIATKSAPGAIGPYSQAIEGGGFIYTSGQLGLNPETGQFGEGVQEQTRQSLNNVKAILEAAGAEMGQIIKTTVFLKDMNDFVAMNEVYSSFFSEPYPARSAVEVARLPKDALVEIEVIVLKN
ncbi:RidA family protein [Paenibacillus sp. IHBB 10380]|uniref:RidA family protein n=1 Tax=Paenibacillus sp. IHBB 10380 TaxID=1566358 RepID=UPI0005CFD50C|nr:RidA family protein [Paenibacillus sp. IHBB 10380]AJS61056.1 endoribonuclease L-PSP [Paenibacillus sp. IHBB 10380]